MSTINLYDIDPDRLRNDIDKSWGLPANFYWDPTIYQLDLDAIFRRAWQYIGPASRVMEPGDVIVGQAGNVPVVVTRADDGTLHGFVNVCRHRGYRLADKDASGCKRLVCRYHAWSYWLNGDLAHAPGCDVESDFPADQLALVPVAVAEWGPAVYVNADRNAKSFQDSYWEIDTVADDLGVERDPSRYTFRRECVHEVPSNWKLWYDNFVECYHCDNIHRGSFSAAYESSIDSVDTRFLSHFMASRFEPKKSGSTTELRANNYRSLNIFPGSLILQHDDLMIMSQMRPTGPETTTQLVHYFAEKGSDPEKVDAWIDLWHQTFTEDGDATAIQQEGLRAGMVERNRLLRAREEAVFFFNRLTCEAYKSYLETTPPQASLAAE